jgi:hypothetical protein
MQFCMVCFSCIYVSSLYKVMYIYLFIYIEISLMRNRQNESINIKTQNENCTKLIHRYGITKHTRKDNYSQTNYQS